MTLPADGSSSNADPVVLAGEPDSVHVLEGSDDDLPLGGLSVEDVDEGPRHSQGRGRQRQAVMTGADAIMDASPTALGEGSPHR